MFLKALHINNTETRCITSC